MASSPVGFGLLLRIKLRILRNRTLQIATQAPLKFVLALTFLAGIWLSLYGLFFSVFSFIHERWAFESIVAQPLIFEILFAVLTVMLAFSNGIIVYGGLFRQPEAAYLMATPMAPVDIVRIRHLEGLFFASWSLVVLGIPLMLAFARSTGAPWYFHGLFLAYFIAFLPLPCAAGTLTSGLIALWFPRSAKRALLVLAGVGLAGVCLWVGSFWYALQTGEHIWLKRFFTHTSIVRSAALPSTWASRGIQAAARADLFEAGFYLAVLVSNALFSTWLVVRLLGRILPKAFDRAQGSNARHLAPGLSFSTLLGRFLFALLPARLRPLAVKDLRTFLRDAMQWSQMAILFGLLLLYVVNLPRLSPQLNSPQSLMLVSFLNLATVAFILATFTGRFVFPIVSLEMQQLWLVGMWPLDRGRLLVGKLLFALTITLLAALTVVLLSAVMLGLSPIWAVTNALIITAVCVGLCGLAVGLGARFPDLRSRNPARIAGGVGGTINLICSLLFVCVVLVAAAGAHYQAARTTIDRFDPVMIAVLVGVVGLSSAVTVAAMRIGARHFRSLES